MFETKLHCIGFPILDALYGKQVTIAQRYMYIFIFTFFFDADRTIGVIPPKALASSSQILIMPMILEHYLYIFTPNFFWFCTVLWFNNWCIRYLDAIRKKNIFYGAYVLHVTCMSAKKKKIGKLQDYNCQAG